MSEKKLLSALRKTLAAPTYKGFTFETIMVGGSFRALVEGEYIPGRFTSYREAGDAARKFIDAHHAELSAPSKKAEMTLGEKVERELSAPAKVKAHPQFTEKDYDYLRGKGYSDSEILSLWDRDKKDQKPAQEHRIQPGSMGPLKRMSAGERIERKLSGKINWAQPHKNESTVSHQGRTITVAQNVKTGRWSWEVNGEDGDAASKEEAIRQAKSMAESMTR